jgi:hypothetical protein
MAIERIIKNWQADPWDVTTDTVSSMHIQSVHYSGSFQAVTAPATANYPDALHDTPTRYFVELPLSIDVTDLAGLKPIAIYDNNSSATLTRVTGSPSANEYRVPVAASERNNVIEVNAAQASHVLEYDLYGMNTVINKEFADYIRNNMCDVKNCSSDYTITDTDGYQVYECSSSDVMSTITLPTLANNIGRPIILKNLEDGITKAICSGSDTIENGSSDNTYLYLHSKNDKLHLIGGKTEWQVIDYCDIISTGWVNRSDWSNVHIGSVTVNIDGGSSGSLGFELGEGVSSSNAGGRIINITDNADGTGILILYECTGGGSFINNAAITGNNSSAAAVVNGATLNVDSNFYHGSGLDMDKYNKIFQISTDGTNNNSFEIGDVESNYGAATGWIKYQIDTNNFMIQTGLSGLTYITGAGAFIPIDAENWFHRIIYERGI